MNQNKFNQHKEKQLKRKDKSNEGHIDKPILALCKKINSKPNYYTTSSCSGRIILVKQGRGKTKSKNAFLFKTHKKTSYKELKKAINLILKSDYSGLVYFKLDSCILHISCLNLESAQSIVDKAKFSGWKRSGIMSTKKRINVELLSTEKLEFPIINKNKILTSDKYIKIIIKQANKKLKNTHNKMKKLEKLI